MNKKQAERFNRMRDTLRRIAMEYQTPDQLRRSSNKQWGLDYQEALEYSYENVQQEARAAIRGIRAAAE